MPKPSSCTVPHHLATCLFLPVIYKSRHFGQRCTWILHLPKRRWRSSTRFRLMVTQTHAAVNSAMPRELRSCALLCAASESSREVSWKISNGKSSHQICPKWNVAQACVNLNKYNKLAWFCASLPTHPSLCSPNPWLLRTPHSNHVHKRHVMTYGCTWLNTF